MCSEESLKQTVTKVKEIINQLNIPKFDCNLYPVKKGTDIKKPIDLANYIEHTALKPETLIRDVITLCHQAKEYGFCGVCVNPVYVAEAKKQLVGTNCLIITVIGFPLGTNLSDTKVSEVRDVISAGADEIDMVISLGLLKSGEYQRVFDDIRGVVEVAEDRPVKVIIETCLLTSEEKVIACLLAKRAGAAFVKTSTGFNKEGATVKDVELMRIVIGDKMGIKAAGGIRDFLTARALINAGADRLGCSSSVKIISYEEEI